MAQTPLVGAIAVVVTQTHVLLAKRKKQPDAGLWGFPGGHVELGETALAAAARELHEETGIHATPRSYLTNIDVLHHGSDGTVQTHYLLAAVWCEYISGTPEAADDVSAAAWFPFADVRRGSIGLSAQVCDVMDLAIAAYQTRRAAPRVKNTAEIR